MDKLALAHSYMVEYVKSNGLDVTDLEVRCAFDIAEAMLAENEKRTDKTRPAVLDEFKLIGVKRQSGLSGGRWMALAIKLIGVTQHRILMEILMEILMVNMSGMSS